MDHINPNQQEPHLKCPRCDSNNTKFCYYNNYNLSQPRHYCKHCRRYWTKGGTLRNIPVGGATRKITKRSSSTSNQIKKASPPVMMTSPPPPPPPAQPSPPQSLKTEGSVSYGFSSMLGFGSSSSSSMGAFGNLLMDGLSSYNNSNSNNNLVSKSNDDDNVLIRNPIAADDMLRVNDESDHRNRNQNRIENSDGNGSERGMEWNGIGWPDLSIFTPAAGSSFH